MQLAATIAVVLSVLVLAFQARALAAQSRVANEVAGTQAHREILFHFNAVINPVFIQYPELYGYFYDETTATPSASDSVRLKALADQFASWFETGFITSEQLGAYAHGIGDWAGYFTRQLAASTPLRSYLRDNPGLFPVLDPFLAKYDASHPQSR